MNALLPFNKWRRIPYSNGSIADHISLRIMNNKWTEKQAKQNTNLKKENVYY